MSVAHAPGRAFRTFTLAASALVALLATNACLRMEAPSVRSEERKTAVFVHSGSESVCSQCHEADRPALGGGLSHGEGRECSSCHQSSATSSAWAKNMLAYDHGYGPANCLVCHEASRPAQSHYPAPGPSPVPGHFGTADCSQCHVARETAYPNFVFQHKNSARQTVSTCLPCHDAKRPAQIVKRFLHSLEGTGDCVTCHLLPGSIWSSGIYRHTPAPTACGTCHTGDRPAEPIHRFLHSAVNTDECVSCHSNASSGSAWTGGIYSHAPVPSACANCHETNRPVTTLHRFSHASGQGLGDCKGCHSGVGTTWTGGIAVYHGGPRNCAQCH